MSGTAGLMHYCWTAVTNVFIFPRSKEACWILSSEAATLSQQQHSVAGEVITFSSLFLSNMAKDLDRIQLSSWGSYLWT